jgi:hypothetical protein
MRTMSYVFISLLLCSSNYAFAMESTKKPEKQVAKIIAQKEYAQRYCASWRLKDTEELDILDEISNKLPVPLDKKLYRSLCKAHTLIDAALYAIIKKLADHHSRVTGSNIETISSIGMCSTIPANMKKYLCKKAITSLRGWSSFAMWYYDFHTDGVMCISERCNKAALETKDAHELVFVDLKTNTRTSIAHLSKTAQNFGQFNCDGSRLAVANGSQNVTLYDSVTGVLVQTITYPMVINRVLFSRNNTLVAYQNSVPNNHNNNSSYTACIGTDGMYGSPTHMPMAPRSHSSIQKTKNYELFSTFGTISINKKPSPFYLLCLHALDNSNNAIALSNIKSSTAFNSLDAIEKGYFEREIDKKLKSLTQESAASLTLSTVVHGVCTLGIMNR